MTRSVRLAVNTHKEEQAIDNSRNQGRPRRDLVLASLAREREDPAVHSRNPGGPRHILVLASLARELEDPVVPLALMATEVAVIIHVVD